MACVGDSRLARVRKVLEKNKLDALILVDVHNIHWTSAFNDVFDSSNAHCMIVTRDDAVLHTDTRYVNSCEVAARESGIDMQIACSGKPHQKFAYEFLSKRLNLDSASIGVENIMPLFQFRKFQEVFPQNLQFVETDGLVLKVRMVKDSAELKALQKAQDITDAAFAHIFDFVRPGMSEKQVQLELENFMMTHGAQDLAFSTIVATGENAANPHAIPGETKLEAGQCLLLDYGAKWGDYCSDMTRTIFLGQSDAQSKIFKAFEAVRCANETAEAAIKAGAVCKDIHNLAESVLEKSGFGGKMGHGLGHGVGMEIHEEPVLSPKSSYKLEPGNVVTVEPGVYFPGEFGIRLEDCGYVTEDGFAPFTQTSHEMFVK